MTCIAWDGKTLAGDKQATVDGVPIRVRKVFKVKFKDEYFLIGCSGDLDRGKAYIKRFRKDGFDASPCKGSQILILGKKKHHVLAEDGELVSMDENKWAIGSAGCFALGAMHAGADANNAVKIANKLSIESGIGVDTVKF